MAIVIYWYEFICFAIVGITVLASLRVLRRNEFANTRKDGNAAYQSALLGSRADTDGYVEAVPRNYVGFNQLWTSCWKGVHPGWLMVSRLVSFLIMAGILLWDIIDWGFTIFMYYTGWTFALVIVYFAIGTAMSVYGCWVSTMQILIEDEESGTTSPITYRRKKAGFWGYLMQAVYQTCAGAVLFADLSFWCIIVPFGSKEELGLNMLMGCMHILNAVFLLLDTTLNNMSFPWFRLAYFVIWGCLYVVFQWVIHAYGFTWWPYPFLKVDVSWAPYWYVALVLLHIPFYGIYALIIKAKNSLFSKWFPKAFVRPY